MIEIVVNGQRKQVNMSREEALELIGGFIRAEAWNDPKSADRMEPVNEKADEILSEALLFTC
jgi:hypothetical protein